MKSTRHSAEALATSAMNATQREREAWKLAYGQPEMVPAGWRTTPQWAKLWGKCEASARALMARLVKSGVMVKKKFAISMKDGRVRPQPHYRLAD